MKITHHGIRMTDGTAALLAAFLAAGAGAETRHVPNDYLTIQEAIDAAVDGDEVVVADGTWTGVGNKDVVFGGKALTLRSESGNREGCIIDCEGDGRFATFTTGDTAIVMSITVENGSVPGAMRAGGINAILGSSSSLIGCAFRDCRAGWGGAVNVSTGSSMTIDDCVFERNVATNSGGAVIAAGSAFICTSSSFTGNVADRGGGVQAASGRISRCIFRENVADIAGGGAFIEGDFEEISDSLFQDNVNTGAGGGGAVTLVGGSASLRGVAFLDNCAQFAGAVGIYGDPGSPTFVNCLFAGNNAVTPADGEPGAAGAVDIWVGTPTFVNCTFSGNTAEGDGGAIVALLDADATFVGTVLWGNEAPNGPEIVIGLPGLEGGTVTVSSSDVAGGEAGVSIGDGGVLEWGDGNIDEDPLLDDHYCLSDGSPAIDAGDDSAVPKDVTDDIDGRPRFVDGDHEGTATVDMGAHEFQACAADIDRNGTVDFGDIIRILAAWGPYAPYPPATPEDIDHNGAVDFGDILAVLATWGPCP